MAHLLYDCQYLFDVESIGPSFIYELTIGGEIMDRDFLPIKWEIRNNIEDGQRMEYAASIGNINCLQYLHKEGILWDEQILYIAAENGQLSAVKYLHEEGCPWNVSVCVGAASNGHLECLKYLHKEGCPSTEAVCMVAVCSGHLECFKYLREEDCEWDRDMCISLLLSQFCSLLHAFSEDRSERYGPPICNCIDCLEYVFEGDSSETVVQFRSIMQSIGCLTEGSTGRI